MLNEKIAQREETVGNDVAAWKEKETMAKRSFVDFAQANIGKEFGYEDWQQVGLKDFLHHVEIPAGGRWTVYLSKNVSGTAVVGGKVFNSEGLLVNQFEFAVE